MSIIKRKHRNNLLQLAILAFASLLMAIDYRTFVEWGGIYPGGAAGLSMLVQRIVQSVANAFGFSVTVPFGPINLAINAIPVWIGFRYVGKKFTLKSLYVIFLSSVFTDILPMDAITSLIPAADIAHFRSEPILTSLFGGLVFGFSIALCLRCNATSGGTDFIAIYLSEKKGRETWNLILAFNAAVLLCGGASFGWTAVLYSIVFQFIYLQTIHLMYRAYQYQTLLIITKKPQKVCEAIYRISHHGATVMPAQGGFKGEARHVVMSVVAADDTSYIYTLCKGIDPESFISTMSTSRVIGRFYLRPRD